MKQPSAAELEKLKKLSRLLDSRFALPGTNIRFGIDSILGLIPGVGDTIGAAFTAYLLKKSSEYQIPKRVRAKMVWNMFIDWLIGLIPFVGDIFDIGWKANNRNMNLFIKHCPAIDESEEEFLVDGVIETTATTVKTS